jgi:hypothetical protein
MINKYSEQNGKHTGCEYQTHPTAGVVMLVLRRCKERSERFSLGIFAMQLGIRYYKGGREVSKIFKNFESVIYGLPLKGHTQIT